MEHTGLISKKQIIALAAIIILMIGLAVAVILVQRQQQIKSKAAGEPGAFIDAFEIKDKNGNILNCDKSTNPPVCTTQTLDISVKVKNTAPLIP